MSISGGLDETTLTSSSSVCRDVITNHNDATRAKLNSSGTPYCPTGPPTTLEGSCDADTSDVGSETRRKDEIQSAAGDHLRRQRHNRATGDPHSVSPTSAEGVRSLQMSVRQKLVIPFTVLQRGSRPHRICHHSADGCRQ